MFSERFDALMRIAEVPNSLLGRAVNMNGSHIGRLRSGARPLPKKHEYLSEMCLYLARHITKEYQFIALQRLTGIQSAVFSHAPSAAQYLEEWLLEQDAGTAAATGRLISSFSRLASSAPSFPAMDASGEMPQKHAPCFYGNAGKRKAVEQFFLMILQEEKPQTLLLFSDENMAWLYEDAAFSARWAELFIQVLRKGNRVRIIHTVARDMNEMLEAVTKWIPIYMTGMIEPYCYPRLRDGLFQRTMFIAPQTAAILSSSVQQDTDGMLNLFLTDKAAIGALVTEYDRYFALCRPLMRIFSAQDTKGLLRAVESLTLAESDTCLYSAVPPLFAMPEGLVQSLSSKSGAILPLWKKSLSDFRKNIEKQRLFVTLLEPKLALLAPQALRLPLSDALSLEDFTYTQEQYEEHIARLKRLCAQHENLHLSFRSDLSPSLLLYVKEDAGVLMAKADAPTTAFVIGERNMTNAFWDYLSKGSLS